MNIKTATALLLLSAISAPVLADGATWVNLGGASHHFKTNWGAGAVYNEKNIGLGIEHEMGGLNYMAGFYKNSIGDTSKYVVAEKILVRWGHHRPRHHGRNG